MGIAYAIWDIVSWFIKHIIYGAIEVKLGLVLTIIIIAVFWWIIANMEK